MKKLLARIACAFAGHPLTGKEHGEVNGANHYSWNCKRGCGLSGWGNGVQYSNWGASDD